MAPGSALLQVIAGAPASTPPQYNLEPMRTYQIGRSRQAGNHILVDGTTASRIHGVIHSNAPGVFVYEEQGANPSKINNADVARGSRRPLTSGDRIQIGDTVFQFIRF